MTPVEKEIIRRKLAVIVEKGLKTLILERGEKPKRIHDIIELHNMVKKWGGK